MYEIEVVIVRKDKGLLSEDMIVALIGHYQTTKILKQIDLHSLLDSSVQFLKRK